MEVLTPAGFDDLLQPADGDFALTLPKSQVPNDAASALLPAPVSLAERLGTWDEDTRRTARLKVELPRNASAETVALAEAVEAAWEAAQYDAALEGLEWLQASGTPVALGVAWQPPLPVGGAALSFGDVRIGTRTGGGISKLDYDLPSGKLFAVVSWATDSGWALYQSTNGGNTWSETFFWFGGTGNPPVDVDMAIVGDYVYVGYVPSNLAREGRMRRNFISSGQPDNGYAYQVALDAGANTITDVAVESNADSFQNRIYYAVRQSDNAVRWAWDVSTDGTTFEEDSPAGAAATGGLDMHWNRGFANWFIFLSFVGTDGAVRVLRHSESAWENIVVDATFTGGHVRTAVSAYDEAVLCAYEEAMTNGQGILYRISYNAGNTWNLGILASPGAAEGGYQVVDITARGGRGTAAVYTQEVGEPDNVFIQFRRGYAPGAWVPRIHVNDYDVTTGSWTALNWTAPATTSPSELSYGLIYLSNGLPYFNLLRRLPGDMNCDGVIDFNDINPFVLALSDPAAYEATYPNCELLNGDCNEDGVIDFGDINPFVEILSGD